jgi:hypothetical protein
VVLGHSGATGYKSDPKDITRDAFENSWATGTNPAVDSIYQRLVAKSPAYKNHAVNLAADGATVDDLVTQAGEIAKIRPTPDIIFVQIVDNDVQCDGSDSQNYGPFTQTLTTALRTITTTAPRAHVYLLSSVGTVQNDADVVATIPSAHADNTGNGPCDLLDASGRPVPAHIAYEQNIYDHYHHQLAVVCGAFRPCRYDNGAMQHLTLTATDLAADSDHLSVQGLKKFADLVWRTFFAG